MPDRLSPLDVSFLYMEESTTAMHVGSVAIFQNGPRGFDHDQLVQLITERINFVPRFRQRVRWVPGHLANPVWVDDEAFDVSFHVRRSALPRPGTDEQLRELVARVMSRRLDRSRPLWEMYLIEGLSGDRFAILSKTHHAMVDGIAAVDIGQVILDTTEEPRPSAPVAWAPAREPSDIELVAGALVEAVRRPTGMIDTARAGVADMRVAATRVFGAATGLLAVARTAARPAPDSPLNAAIGEQRRFATCQVRLDDLKQIRARHGGTVNDVLLAVAAGALRAWLLGRGARVTPSSTVRAMVPVSIRGSEEPGALGNRVASYLVDLPVGEGNPAVRLHQVSYAMREHKETGQAVGAQALVGIAGFAPPTLHSLGARVASGLSRRLFNLVVTNVPGPQFPLYANGSRMLAAYPVVPLARGQALSIGITSYDGGVFFGLNADRDVMPDVEVLAGLLVDAVEELLSSATAARRRKS